MVKYMKILGNSIWGINPIQKQLLYRYYILPIVLYGFQLWFYNKAPLSYPLKILGKIQRRATIWILGAFRTSPTERLKVIAGLIPIKLHLHKLASRSQLRSATLPKNHIIKTLIEDIPTKPFPHSINTLTDCQKNSVKGHLIDSYNKLHGIFPSFSPFDSELNPDSRIIDIFQDWFMFDLANKAKTDSECSQQLDNMTISSSLSPYTAIVVTDASIKNNIATLVSHIHIQNKPLIKMVHHTAYVTSTEVELFTIRCGLNQACIKEDISKIIVVTDSIHTAKKIFNTKSHPYQIHATAILKELRQFFSKGQGNHIKFWEYPSQLKWNLHKSTDRDSKDFNPIPVLLSKISWDFCKKTDSDNCINLWKMTFQASNGKGKQFYDLVDNNLEIIKLSYTKGGPWLQAFGHSNSLCARATRAITNHAPIGKYHLRFFPNEDFKCPCGYYLIETRRHILQECMRHNGYWNPRRDALSHFVMFLSANPKAFAFINNVPSVISR